MFQFFSPFVTFNNGLLLKTGVTHSVICLDKVLNCTGASCFFEQQKKWLRVWVWCPLVLYD
jgi:hypothetical protein